MIKIEKTEVFGWKAAIRGMRNAHNSWDKSDSYDMFDFLFESDFEEAKKEGLINKDCVWNPNWPEQGERIVVGKNDLKLMRSLAKAGTDHSKFARMINVTVDITAPLYLFKETDTYKIGTVCNSCSTMHTIHSKEFTLDDFSHEHLLEKEDDMSWSAKNILDEVIMGLNHYRKKYLYTKDKKYWWQIIQLLPSSYNQKRTYQFNYQVLWNIYRARKNHKLDEWRDFCKWIENLPYFKEIYLEKQE